jgi:hypothetical protein
MIFDFQVAFNIAFALAGALGGFVLHALWQADKDLADKVGRIEVLVAGQYIKRCEVETKLDAIFRKLDRIEEKLDDKADKQ